MSLSRVSVARAENERVVLDLVRAAAKGHGGTGLFVPIGLKAKHWNALDRLEKSGQIVWRRGSLCGGYALARNSRKTG